jgi:hypothetical protein
MQPPTAQPAVTKRIGEYDPISKDFPSYVIFEDGHEEYIGSRPTHHDASLLASDYIIQWYQDNHTPEKAAQLIHEELAQEGRHKELAVQMGATWEQSEIENWYCPRCSARLLTAYAQQGNRPYKKCCNCDFATPPSPLDGGDPEAVEIIDPVCPCGGVGCPCCDPSHPEAPERGWEREEAERTPTDPPPCDDRGGCPERDPIEPTCATCDACGHIGRMRETTDGTFVCVNRRRCQARIERDATLIPDYSLAPTSSEDEPSGIPSPACWCAAWNRQGGTGLCPACQWQAHQADPSIPPPLCTAGGCTCPRPATRESLIPGFPLCDECDRTGLARLKAAIFGGEPEPAARVNWSEGPGSPAPLHPVQALKLALERGVFGLETTLAALRASYEAATPTTECACCNTMQRCYDDGETYICVDRSSCRARCQADEAERAEAEDEPRTPPLLARGPFAAVRWCV